MQSALEQLQEIRVQALAALNVEDLDLAGLAAWEKHYLSASGVIGEVLKQMGGLPTDERPLVGRETNAVKRELTSAWESRRTQMQEASLHTRLSQESIDITLPGRVPPIGTIHPISQMIDEVSEIFAYLGFETVFGPEVEIGKYNFDMLNIPANHPARDVWDTMIVDDDRDEIVLRTHTSPMQARVMEQRQPPVRVIVPGRVFRFEAQDASHEWMFHQIEGLAIDAHITMTDLKGVLTELARQLFGSATEIRFRCDFFPFVEPGVDFSVSCPFCKGKGCRVCKHSGWIELGGAGMVHPNVLRWVNYDPDLVQGFAFGLGVERLAMIKYGINDVRAFAANDVRFLRQFARADFGLGLVTA
ncbi:MAG TPA: phenylalanine--tRNA ligase subunit alpha [Thermomicrobiales bacterium]|nr:phenylalanine--tRNA ligase subunit alpha [Thermomicrobiales bacterium]HRA48318.1 phenylalanine--tRNA ligase subunit alpha [Thermomicrobiales bacterium]